MSNLNSKTEPDKGLDPKKIVKMAVFFELPLAIVFLLYCWYQEDWSAFVLPSINQILDGIILSLVLFIANLTFYVIIYRYKLMGMISFVEGVVEPLASALNPFYALIVSIAAGVGEEFFFRGLLLPLVGLLLSSIAFALLHFIFEIRRYLVLCLIYTLIGLLFGIIYLHTKSIWVVVIFHSTYDFLALMFFSSNFRLKFKANYQ